MALSDATPDSGSGLLWRNAATALWWPRFVRWDDALRHVEREWEAAGLRCTYRVVRAGRFGLLDTAHWDWYRAGVFFARSTIQDPPAIVLMPSQTDKGILELLQPDAASEESVWKASSFAHLRDRERAWPSGDTLELRHAGLLRVVHYQLRHGDETDSLLLLCVTESTFNADKHWVSLPLLADTGGSVSSIQKIVSRVCASWTGAHTLRALFGRMLKGMLPSPEVDEPHAGVPEFILTRHLARMDFFLPGTRLGLDPECLHQMRVAARRLGAAVRLLQHDEAGAAWASQTKAIERALGAVRDLDVFVDRLRLSIPDAQAEAFAPVFALLEQRQRRAHATLLEYLEGPEFQSAHEGLAAQLHQWEIAGLPEKAGKKVPREVEHLRRRVQKQARGIGPGAPARRIHQLRKAFKKLRYHAEIAAEWKPRKAAALARTCAQWQDLLGEHQDAIVACQMLRDLAEELATTGAAAHATTLAIGEHIGQENARAAAILRHFIDARDAGLALHRLDA